MRKAVEVLLKHGLKTSEVEELLVRCPHAVALVNESTLEKLKTVGSGQFWKTALLRDPEMVFRKCPSDLIKETQEISDLGVPSEDLVMYVLEK